MQIFVSHAIFYSDFLRMFMSDLCYDKRIRSTFSEAAYIIL